MPLYPPQSNSLQNVPGRVLVISGVTLLLPMVALLLRPEWMEGEGALLVWLPALLPAPTRRRARGG